jgi:hypothetical protein
MALAAIDATIVYVTAQAWLEHHLGQLGLQNVVVLRHHVSISSVKTEKARCIGASTTIDVRTDVSWACMVMRSPRLLA